MLDRQRITTLGITTAATAALALAVWLKPWTSQGIPCSVPAPGDQVNAVPSLQLSTNLPAAAPQQIDLVFAIDTTGSMGPLLDSAKRAVWSIASHIKQV